MDLTYALDQIGAVRRELTSIYHRGKPARALTAEQTYAADAADVWDALTNPERLPRWFTPVEGDLREGGRYQLTGNAGGTIETCRPPRSLAVTWEYGDGMSWVEVDLAEADGRTTVVLRHIMETDALDEHSKRYGPGAVGIGWDLSLLGLQRHLESGETADPAAVEEWSQSEAGRAFMTRSSDAWFDADVTDGADPADARLRADRTTAFYLGEQEPA
ncbi:SRPBCC family protein [Nocardioides sp. GXQ0305]|uniref:SRPBCC family protein n=1 Tax=Nocardioides sp. GXQ0305 TaxID=3423912 RepID=UPI003D7CB639